MKNAPFYRNIQSELDTMAMIVTSGPNPQITGYYVYKMVVNMLLEAFTLVWA